MYLYMVFYYIIELKGGNMSSWFDYDEDEIYNKRIDINDEIISDTVLRLAPNTLLWRYLCSQDLTQDYIKVTSNDLEKARASFINCGYPLVLKTYNEGQLINWFNSLEPYVVRNLDNYKNRWIADINKLADVDTLTDHEIAFLHYDEQIAREFLLLCSLQINWHIMIRERKLNSIIPVFFDWDEPSNVSHEEVKKHVLTWKHVPSRFKNE